MTDKKKEKTKKELETELKEVTDKFEQLSAGYQAAINRVNQLSVLVNNYEETINLLTTRLLEGRAQP
jgi:chromosome segregation ATPase